MSGEPADNTMDRGSDGTASECSSDSSAGGWADTSQTPITEQPQSSTTEESRDVTADVSCCNDCKISL